MFSTPRYSMKSLHFCKVDISLILTKFHHDHSQHRHYVLNKKVLNNLIIKTQRNYSSFSDKNSPRTNKDKITTSSEPSATKVNFHKENMSETPTVKNDATTSSDTLSSLLSTFQTSSKIK